MTSTELKEIVYLGFLLKNIGNTRENVKEIVKELRRCNAQRRGIEC